jgi:hypothetical protein
VQHWYESLIMTPWRTQTLPNGSILHQTYVRMKWRILCHWDVKLDPDAETETDNPDKVYFDADHLMHNRTQSNHIIQPDLTQSRRHTKSLKPYWDARKFTLQKAMNPPLKYRVLRNPKIYSHFHKDRQRNLPSHMNQEIPDKTNKEHQNSYRYNCLCWWRQFVG